MEMAQFIPSVVLTKLPSEKSINKSCQKLLLVPDQILTNTEIAVALSTVTVNTDLITHCINY